MRADKTAIILEQSSENNLIQNDNYLSEMSDRLHRLRALIAEADAPKSRKAKKPNRRFSPRS